jgi:error-prone DNA polymerase
VSSYVELHCHSNFSLLDGASHPETLVERAAQLGMSSLSLTDHDNVYGAVRFAQVAQAAGVKPIFGAELTLEDGHHLLVLVKNRMGWRNLCTLITLAHHHAPKGEAALPLSALEGHTEGLFALTACRNGAVPAALLRGETDTAIVTAKQYQELFGKDNLWIELQAHLLPDDKSLNHQLVALSRYLGVGYVATNDVHYALPEGYRLQDILVCIKHGKTLDEALSLRRPNAEYYLKPASQLAMLFEDYPHALPNSLVIAEQCDFTPGYRLQELPVYPLPSGMSALSFLRQLCLDALPHRYPDPPSHAFGRLEHELGVIDRSGLANYFLIVYDIVKYARDSGIRCQGRGSAANSLVAYLLHITPVDPLSYNLVFERFLSDERKIAPDIDIDFDAKRREEVIQYIYAKYGVDHAAMASTLVTYRTKSALRDVAKALGLPQSALNGLSAKLEDAGIDLHEPLAETQRRADFNSAVWQYLIEFARQLRSFPRHLGIHNGGFVITGSPITEYVPTEPATMEKRFVVQWDKDSLEDSGLVKVDILGLRMLSAIAETVKLVEETQGIHLDLDTLTFDDPRVFQMMCLADTMGVFQVESRAQTQILPFLRPREFHDVIVSISLVRPGPVMANMVHPYIRRRNQREAVTYLHPSLKPALEPSLGVMLWQEQIPLVAHALSGFSLGQGEQMRRTLGKKHAEAQVRQVEEAFLKGANRNGVRDEVAKAVFEQIKGFGGYAFPKSHAAAFAVMVYQSAWLRCYYPVEFCVGLLRHQPMGFWSPSALINDAKRRGIRVLPVSINASRADCTVEQGAIRMGLSYVAGLGEKGSTQVETARGSGRFRSLTDFYTRTRLPLSLIENLIIAGAMDEWGIPRRQLLWELGTTQAQDNPLGLIFDDEAVELPALSRSESLEGEYRMLGLSVHDHAIALYRDELFKRGILTSTQLHRCRDGQQVSVAGMQMVLQRPPTAKGFAFLTLEDEFNLMNIILRPAVFNQYRRMLRGLLLIVEGKVQKRGHVTNVLANKIQVIT